MQGLDQRLDAQVALLATAIGPDGKVDRPAGSSSPAPFGRAGSGWGRRIDAPTGTIALGRPAPASTSLSPPEPHGHRRRRHDDGEPYPLDWRDATAAPATPAA